jgi:hypothetical protein
LYFIALFLAIIDTLVYKKNLIKIWMPKGILLFSAVLVILGAIISMEHTLNLRIALIELCQTIYVITIFLSLILYMVIIGKEEKTISAFVLSGVFAATVASIDFFLGKYYGLMLSGIPNISYLGRFTGPLGHPNKLGYFLVITIILTFYKLIATKGKRKGVGVGIALFFALLIQGIGIYLSGSVTAYIGLLVGVFCLLYAFSSAKLRKTIIIFGYFLIICLLIFEIIRINLVYPPSLFFPESSLVGKGINRVLNITAKARLDLYKLAMDYILRNPIIGIGFDQNASSGIMQDLRLLAGSIHNPFIQLFYIGGFFAFLGWLLIHFHLSKIAFINIFKQSSKHSFLTTMLSVIVIAMVVMDQSTNAIYAREKWLAVGLLLGLTLINNKTTNIHYGIKNIK